MNICRPAASHDTKYKLFAASVSILLVSGLRSPVSGLHRSFFHAVHFARAPLSHLFRHIVYAAIVSRFRLYFYRYVWHLIYSLFCLLCLFNVLFCSILLVNANRDSETTYIYIPYECNGDDTICTVQSIVCFYKILLQI